jgi:hypothetical protein
VAARRVADGDDPAEIERIGVGEPSENVGGLPNVDERAGIPASSISQPAELDVPGRDADRGKRLGEGRRVVARPVNVPGAAVDDDGDGIPAGRRSPSGQA